MRLESNHGSVASFIMWWIFLRGAFLGGLLLMILFGGETSLMDAIIAWIGRH